ncbi:MAG TPA: winged helix-turn-helix domain-containing protein [Stellaceae bacterium]
MAFRFGEYVLDPERRELRSGVGPVAVEPQVFDLLLYLLRNRDRVVTKDDLIAEVWGGRIVSDSALTSRLNAARRAVADSGTSQRVIRTIARRGVRFIAEVIEPEEVAAESVVPSERPAAPRLSIVVLPFVNLSDDAEQQYFADGVTGDLTGSLSQLPDMLVISRNTAFTYRDRPVDTRQIGRDLNVRYVLEGEVQRSGARVRVTAQLIDAETDAHLWAERFDGGTEDLFAVRDEITSRIAATLDLELVEADAARPVEQPDALDYILRGRAIRLQPPSRENRTLAIDLFERALTLDPRSVGAQAWVAIALTARVLDSMACDPAADIARAAELAELSLAASPRRALAHFAKAQVLRAQHRYAEAIFEYAATIELNPNWAHAYSHLGWCRFMTGEIKELIPAQERAIRLSPRDPQIGLLCSRIGCAHHLEARLDQAITWFEKARTAAPGHPQFRAFLASAYALTDNPERAAAELAEARRLVGDDRYSTLARLRDIEKWDTPAIHDRVEQTYFAGLRQAGMPER